MPPTAGVAQSLRFEQVRFTALQLLLGLLPRMDVGEQVVPADDLAVRITQREPSRLEPAVLAIMSSNPVLEFVRLSGVDRVLPGGHNLREIGRVNRVRS